MPGETICHICHQPAKLLPYKNRPGTVPIMDRHIGGYLVSGESVVCIASFQSTTWQQGRS